MTMSTKTRPDARSIFPFVKPLAGVALLVVLVFFLDSLLASVSSQTANQPQQPASLPVSPGSITSVDLIDKTEEWKVFSDSEYGYSIKYPPDWVATELEPTPTDSSRRIVVFRPDVPPSYFFAISDGIDPDVASVASLSVQPRKIEDVLVRMEQLAILRKQQIVVGGIWGVRVESEALGWDYRKQRSATEPVSIVLLPVGSNTLTLRMSLKPLLFTDYPVDFTDVFNTMLASLTIQ